MSRAIESSIVSGFAGFNEEFPSLRIKSPFFVKKTHTLAKPSLQNMNKELLT